MSPRQASLLLAVAVLHGSVQVDVGERSYTLGPGEQKAFAREARSEEGEQKALGTATVTTDLAPLMLGKEIIATVRKDTVLRVTKEQGDWYWIDPPGGWIRKRYVRFGRLASRERPPQDEGESDPAPGAAEGEGGPRAEGRRDGEGGAHAEGRRDGEGGATPRRKTKIGKIYNTYDANKDDRVTFSEWLALRNGVMDAARRAREKTFFDRADRNRNGTVSFEEFEWWCNVGKKMREGGGRSPEAEAGPRRSPEAEAGARRSPEAEAGARDGAREGD